MKYARWPGNYWFWLAHNVSIYEDTFDSWSPGLHWYHKESRRERVYINDADWLLFLTGFVEIGATIDAAIPFPLRVIQAVFRLFVELGGSKTDLVKYFALAMYPRQYPTGWFWFFRPFARRLTKAACFIPVFPGPCGLG